VRTAQASGEHPVTDALLADLDTELDSPAAREQDQQENLMRYLSIE